MTHQIYVASLSDYNAGILHGKWIELTDYNTVRNEINSMLKASPYSEQYGEEAEEYAIHDFELGGLKISEYEDIEALIKLTEAIEEYGEAFRIFYISVNYNDLDGYISAFQDAYCGEYSFEHGQTPMENYSEEIFNETHSDNIPESLRQYIDYQRFSNDLEANGYWEEDGHVFSPA